MYSLILIGLISKCLNTSDYRYQQECGTAWKIFGWKHNRCFAWWKTWKYPDNYVKKFWEVYWKLPRDDFYSKIPIRNLFFFLLQVKEMNMSKRKSFFFYKLISTVIFWKLSQERIILPDYIEMLQLLLREIVSICLSLLMFWS